MSTPLVEARGITKRYGPTVALQDGQLTVLPGESHALVGRNGAGKSTLVTILTGLQAAHGFGQHIRAFAHIGESLGTAHQSLRYRFRQALRLHQ